MHRIIGDLNVAASPRGELKIAFHGGRLYLEEAFEGLKRSAKLPQPHLYLHLKRKKYFFGMLMASERCFDR